MIEAYGLAQVRAAEEAAGSDLPDLKLMMRAAKGLAQVVRARLENHGGKNVVAIVGSGNNGGDALFALARLGRKGTNVAVIQVGQAIHDAGLDAAIKAGAVLADASSASPGRIGPDSAWLPLLAEADVVIDGIVGIGGKPGLSEAAYTVVRSIPEDAYVIAVDLPSGCDPTGRVTSVCVYADETVTFGVLKPVHLLRPTEVACGLITVVDIGLPALPGRPDVERLTRDDVVSLWPVPHVRSDKYSRGVLGIVAGSPAYPGAAVLTTLGALGAGPGMIRYAGPPKVVDMVLAAAPEVVRRPGRVEAWVVGPGVDSMDDALEAKAQRERIDQVYGSNAPVLVDAGALPGYANRIVEGLRRGPDVVTVLTPHAGEAAVMLGILDSDGGWTRDQVTDMPVVAAQLLADRTEAVVLLKGSTTLIVAPTSMDRPMRSQADAPGWLATAGAGDVLAGVIGTLLAAGLDPLDAASLGALVHGVAADEANPGGPVRALDVAHALPGAIAGLLRRGLLAPGRSGGDPVL